MSLNLNELNKQQIEAVEHVDGPILVVAGAGSGKTKVLTSRIAYLLDEVGIPDQQVLAITFTNRAAEEMRQRVGKLIQRGIKTSILTYHALCLRILREDIEYVHGKRDFNILDVEDRKQIINNIYKDWNLNDGFSKLIKPSLMFDIIDVVSSNECAFESDSIYVASIEIDDIKQHFDQISKLNPKDQEYVIGIYREYIKRKKEINALDYNDLINGVYKLFKHNEEIVKKWKRRFNYILVDEFQDTDYFQFQILRYLVNENHNVFAVGDPDQTIYQWRGAYAGIFDDYINAFAPKQVLLEKNYRSTTNILTVANTLIENNVNRIPKYLISNISQNAPVIYYDGYSSFNEGSYIAKTITDLVKNKKYEYSDIMVLYRNNFLSRFIERSLIDAGIPYYIYGGFKFYERKEIKDLLAYLKLVNSPNDELSFIRVINRPKRNIGEETIQKIRTFAANKKINFMEAIKLKDDPEINWNTTKIHNFLTLMENIRLKIKDKKIHEGLTFIIAAIQYEDFIRSESLDNVAKSRLDNIKELIDSIKEYENTSEDPSLKNYLDSISLYTDSSSNDERYKNKNTVSLMTVHYAKGTERKVVFLSGLYQGVLPSSRSLEKNEVEEERRIAFVAITRAKELLYLTTNHGSMPKPSFPSQFINEIGHNNFQTVQSSYQPTSDLDLNWFDSSKSTDFSSMYSKEKTNQYHVGDNIVHTYFGKGIVVEVVNDMITIMFAKPHGKKTLVANHKAIKRILN